MKKLILLLLTIISGLSARSAIIVYDGIRYLNVFCRVGKGMSNL